MLQPFHALLELLKNERKVCIQPHNIPDPDAIASSFALKSLLSIFHIESTIIYVDLIEKANSKSMVEMFFVPLELKGKGFVSHSDDFVIMVDTQLGNSNVTDLGSTKLAVIDHHQELETSGYLFDDIRSDMGACSSIIALYYQEMDIVPSLDVATALVYGIMTDTDNLTRNNNNLDADMFYWLNKYADSNRIKHLRMNEIGKDDIYAYAKALQNIEIYGNIGFIHIEDCNDSLLGTISDMVYTIEGVSIVISYAKRLDGIKFSIRSGLKNIQANALVKYILNDKGVGGGHDEMAGGFIVKEQMDFLKNRDLDTYVRYRVLSYLEKEDSL
jgi:nanoRNase/pAp phosphatase (c-di-AMP/oligoRNAs hydrolase)